LSFSFYAPNRKNNHLAFVAIPDLFFSSLPVEEKKRITLQGSNRYWAKRH
jgi:hypothetical protein